MWVHHHIGIPEMRENLSFEPVGSAFSQSCFDGDLSPLCPAVPFGFGVVVLAAALHVCLVIPQKGRIRVAGIWRAALRPI